MAKYAGLVGYATQEETRPGVWKDIIRERMVTGDLISQSTSFQSSDKVNEDVNITNRLSFVGNPNDHLGIKYVTYLGYKWKVASIETQPPRLILTLGGMWNG